MATRQLPDADLLRKLMRYDPETVKLYWRERTPDMFKDDCRLTADARSREWNTRYAGKEALATPSRGYLRGCIRYKFGLRLVLAHRVVWAMHHNEWPDQLDHINQDKLDNRLENLRPVTHEENGRNCRLSKRNSSGVIGVHWVKSHQKWRARIRANGRYIELGTFTSFDDACDVRRRAEIKFSYSPLHGKQGS